MKLDLLLPGDEDQDGGAKAKRIVKGHRGATSHRETLSELLLDAHAGAGSDGESAFCGACGRGGSWAEAAAEVAADLSEVLEKAVSEKTRISMVEALHCCSVRLDSTDAETDRATAEWVGRRLIFLC